MLPSDSYSQLAYIATALIFALCIAAETFAPRREPGPHTAWRWLNNLGLSGLTWYLNLLLGTLFITWLAGWSHLNELGLLARLGTGPVLSGLLLLLVIEFINYWVHYTFHRFPLLWRLHAVHHTDTDIDVTTSFRHHPVEALATLPIFAPVALFMGAPMEVAMAVHLFSISATVFSHSNVAIPATAEKILRRIILTPDFHRVHHCSEQTFTNSNYGSVVPWFDYLFGTARTRPVNEQQDMELGLEYMRQTRDSRLDQMIVAPLRTPEV
ncbi:hypothetical protein A3709_18125 [Halioglobus sp. HI00S01]|uniref:sterol desaturase family protein n=1 Tax=Halioglobus sp. HI00S01 TaxID=1822214 RepID=UPI0007C35533|nr:sterol desaturase family protein [Halioglobus sp. HI00S01]KZX58624.1 hypothetical protein A3709_18125 [Halioglobus sp. HI00S01]